MATHSSILAWRIPWIEVVGYSPWGRKDSGTTESHIHTHTKVKGETSVCSVQ